MVLSHPALLLWPDCMLQPRTVKIEPVEEHRDNPRIVHIVAVRCHSGPITVPSNEYVEICGCAEVFTIAPANFIINGVNLSEQEIRTAAL